MGRTRGKRGLRGARVIVSEGQDSRGREGVSICLDDMEREGTTHVA